MRASLPLRLGGVPSAPAPVPRSANRRRRPPIHGAKRGVESSDAGEARGERNLGHRHHGLVDEPFRALHPPGRRDGSRRGPRVSHEQSPEMPARHPEPLGEVLDGLAIVEESALDEPHGARDRRRSPAPRRCPWRGLGATPQAGAKPRALSRGGSGKEDDVTGLGGFYRAGGTAIDPCRQDAGKEPSVKSAVSREPRAVAGAPIKADVVPHDSPSVACELSPAAGRDDDVRKRRDGDGPSRYCRVQA